MRPSPPATPPLFVRRCLAGRKCGASISTLRCTRLRWKGREAGKRDSGDTLTHGRGRTDASRNCRPYFAASAASVAASVSQSDGIERTSCDCDGRTDGRSLFCERTGRGETRPTRPCSAMGHHFAQSQMFHPPQSLLDAAFGRGRRLGVREFGQHMEKLFRSVIDTSRSRYLESNTRSSGGWESSDGGEGGDGGRARVHNARVAVRSHVDLDGRTALDSFSWSRLATSVHPRVHI